MEELPTDRSNAIIEKTPELMPAVQHAENCLEHYEDREERVEVFLATNADLFEATTTAWQQVAKSQVPLRATWEKAQTSIAELGNRRTRKEAERKLPNQLKVILNSCKEAGEAFHEDCLEQYLEGQGTNEDKTARALAYAERVREKNVKYLYEATFGAKIDETPEEARPYLSDFANNMYDLQAAYGLANFHDKLALSQLKTLLGDSASVEPFICRVTQIARLAESGIDEFPGLMALLGTHVGTEGNENNLFSKALKKAEIEISDEVKLEFLQEFLNGNGQYRRELTFVRDFMKVMAYDIFPGVAEKDAEVFIAEYAQRRWPEELQAAFTHYLRGKKRTMWVEFRDLLLPHNKPARKPAVKARFGSSHVPLRGHKRKADPSKFTTGSDGRSKLRSKEDSMFGDAPTINAEVVLETEERQRRRIETFGLLKQGEGSRYHVQEIEDLEALLNEGGMSDFLKKYRNEPGIAQTLRAVLTHMTSDPMDRQYSKPYISGPYRLAGEPHNRHMRRFRLKEWPGVQRGSILEKTRIFYDVVNHNGTPELLLYGVFVKEDIPNSGLPRRK